MTEQSELKHQYYLALIPLVAYCCILAFEAGRYEFLGIPLEYVELSSQRIAQLGFVTALLLFFLFIAFTHLITLAEASSVPKSIFGRFVLWGAPLITAAILAAPNWPVIFLAIGFSIVKATDQNLTPEQQDNFDENKASTYEDRVKRRMMGFRTNMISLLWFIGLTSLIFYQVGVIFQRFDETALVKSNAPNSILVGTFAGAFIVKDYDQKSKKLLNGFRLEQIDNQLAITERSIGRLSN